MNFSQQLSPVFGFLPLVDERAITILSENYELEKNRKGGKENWIDCFGIVRHRCFGAHTVCDRRGANGGGGGENSRDKINARRCDGGELTARARAGA